MPLDHTGVVTEVVGLVLANTRELKGALPEARPGKHVECAK